MKTLAIIRTSYLQEPLVRKAREMGIYTICFAWAEGATCRDLCDRFYDISIVEKEQILQICQQEHIEGPRCTGHHQWRMGGDFIGSDLVRLSTGYDFVRGVIDVVLGQFQELVQCKSAA